MAGHSRPKDGVASARLCPAIHVLLLRRRRTWMPGTSPGMTVVGVGRLPLTILLQTALAEHVDCALLDQQVGRALRGLVAERHHQGAAGTAMGDRHSVSLQRVVPVA